MTVNLKDKEALVKELFEAGAHYSYTKSRRHPSAIRYIFGQKGKNDIFDLEQTVEMLEKAKEAIAELTKADGQILFLGGKNEARDIMRNAAERKNQPHSCGRYIGGTLTNFKEIRTRVDKLENLMADRESGALDKFTKLERLMIDREIEDLDQKFGGLLHMKKLPVAVFAVDPEFENKGVAEALQLGIPIIAIANNDCDLAKVSYAIPANDTTRKSIQYLVDTLITAIK
ncbi:MAG: 30S ribosomal protein S2 [Candidatus Pacebacteria bacterium]|nr:30S ribosomal protein S2 [Candidatus Paceibacterota bacterium]